MYPYIRRIVIKVHFDTLTVKTIKTLTHKIEKVNKRSRRSMIKSKIKQRWEINVRKKIFFYHIVKNKIIIY